MLGNPLFVASGRSNGAPANTCPDQGYTEAQVTADLLIGTFGIAPEAIWLEEESTTTIENAANVAALLEGVDYDSLTLVSSNYHLHRASDGVDTSAVRRFNDAFGNGSFVEGVNVVAASTMEQAEPWSEAAFPAIVGAQIRVADIDADGLQDLVAFHDDGVTVHRSDGTVFSPAETWASQMVAAAGWTNPGVERTFADVDGDGMADAVGFGNNDVFVQLSNGTELEPMVAWSDVFSVGDGWDSTIHVRTLADVNGDGMADIVGFGNNDVLVAISNGTAFETPTAWSNDFTVGDGWSTTEHVRVLSDVNGDGMADIVAFGNNSIFVALSEGTGFAVSQNWLPVGGVDGDTPDFTVGQGYLVAEHPRGVSDIDGDGRADVWAIGGHGVYVALSDGERFEHIGGTWYYETEDRHQGEAASYQHFTTGAGWASVATHPRLFADFDGNGLADLVGVSDGTAHVSLTSRP